MTPNEKTMKKMFYIAILASMMAMSCQKAELIEDESQQSETSGRKTEGEPSDSTTVTPDFDING